MGVRCKVSNEVIEEVDTHDTHRILNFIGKDIFQCVSTSIMMDKLIVYEKCISEIKARVDNEIENGVANYWRGVE